MARIDIPLDASMAPPEIHDVPANDGTDRRHIWFSFRDQSGSEVTLHPAYPMGPDHDVVNVLETLIVTMERVRDAALDRIRDREWIAAAKAARQSDTPLGIEDDAAGEAGA